METPFIYFPVKQPIDQQNLFGANPAEYKPLGQAGHPGNDFECPVGTPVYAPCDGDAFYTTDKDAGCGLWIRVPNNDAPQFNVILWHMPPKGTAEYPYQVATDGSTTSVKAGQLLGYSGNSGYPLESTGPHLHLGIQPVNGPTVLYPDNGFQGCVDPQPYFIGHYAQDIQAIEVVVASAATVVQNIAATPDATPAQKLTWIQEIANALESLF